MYAAPQAYLLKVAGHVVAEWRDRQLPPERVEAVDESSLADEAVREFALDLEMGQALLERTLVAEELNRYNRQVIEIRSPELRNQEVTGVFEANDPASFLTFLSGLPGVTVTRSADRSRFVVNQEPPNTTQ
jgi:hypothetical protein